MRDSTLALFFVIAACAPSVPLQPASDPMIGLPPPIFNPSAIQPRLQPGNAAVPLTAAEQAAQNLQPGIRQDQQRNQLNAINPQRPQIFGDPGAPGGTNPFRSDRGEAHLPGLTSDRVPVFQRF